MWEKDYEAVSRQLEIYKIKVNEIQDLKLSIKELKFEEEVAKESFEFLSDPVEANEQLLARKHLHIYSYRNFINISKKE